MRTLCQCAFSVSCNLNTVVTDSSVNPVSAGTPRVTLCTQGSPHAMAVEPNTSVTLCTGGGHDAVGATPTALPNLVTLRTISDPSGATPDDIPAPLTLCNGCNRPSYGPNAILGTKGAHLSPARRCDSASCPGIPHAMAERSTHYPVHHAMGGRTYASVARTAAKKRVSKCWPRFSAFGQRLSPMRYGTKKSFTNRYVCEPRPNGHMNSLWGNAPPNVPAKKSTSRYGCIPKHRNPSNPFAAAKTMTIKPRGLVKKGSSKFLKLGLWNCNSISSSDSKFDFIKEFMKSPSMSVLALTELTQDSSKLTHMLEKHKNFPILTDPKNTRVGLCVPVFFRGNVDIIGSWQYCEARKQKSQIACQITTFKLKLSTVTIAMSVVYLVPDASESCARAMCTEMVRLSGVHKYYTAIGDFNIDQKLYRNRQFFNDHVGGHLHQIVNGVTRRASRKINNRFNVTETIIDLVFLSNDLKSKLVGTPTIRENTPSDHWMVETTFSLSVPSKYVVKEYFLDPTRRPPIPKAKLEVVKLELSNRFEIASDSLDLMPQHEALCHIAATTRAVLDIHNPLNTNEKLRKRIYRFIMSKKTKKLQRNMRKAQDRYRTAKRKKSASKRKLDELWLSYKRTRNVYNNSARDDKRKYDSSKLYDGVQNSSNVWRILKQFDPTPDESAPKPEISIKGKTGTDLANHMATFFLDRAKLVSDEDAKKNIVHVPVPDVQNDVQIDIIDKKYDVEELFKGKKKPTLAAGPDTISHRHIMDLMPVLKSVLQKALDKPLDNLPDVSRNYLRLLSKEKKTDVIFTEKSQRPISELDIIPKYGPIRIFIDQLRNQMIKLLNDNQFAFPGKGGPMAIVTILDFIAQHAKKKSKGALILWDFSNAFCTTIHYLTMMIAKAYNISPRTERLLMQFLEQTLSTIKMSDRNGVYFSEETDMERGGCQGQIGSDFLFSLINDKIQPQTVFDEIICRVKYVDDFTDGIVACSAQTLFESLRQNEAVLVAQATSIGLKINPTKLKVILANILERDVPQEYIRRGDNQILVTHEKLLGFEFEIVNPNRADSLDKPFFLCGNRAAQNLIARLSESVRVMCALRKVSHDIHKKVAAATNLVFKNCYDIGLVYAYADRQHFQSVSVAIRRVLKAAGLDYMTNSEKLHRVTLKMSPALMAVKQIIQLGVKMIDTVSVRDNRYIIPQTPDDHLKPFWGTFLKEFNGLPQTSRQFVVEHIGSKMDAVKNHLKAYFVKLYNPDGLMSDKRKSLFLNRNLYKLSKGMKRKADYLQRATTLRDAELAKQLNKPPPTTPKQRRKKNSSQLSTPLIIRKQRKVFAPMRPICPPAKSARYDEIVISTPQKRGQSIQCLNKRPRWDERIQKLSGKQSADRLGASSNSVQEDPESP